MHHLHIDVETYSPEDLKKCGLYKYVEHPDFEIQLFGYAIDDEPVQCLDLTEQPLPIFLKKALQDPTVIKHAHNATFERRTLSKYLGVELPIEQWECSMIKCAYCGLPLALDAACEILQVEHQKIKAGKDLIKVFAKPIKPTKNKPLVMRNYPKDFPELWTEYKGYNIGDVESERDLCKALSIFEIPEIERQLYIFDQEVNDRGILVDLNMANNAIEMDAIFAEKLTAQLRELTGIANPKSSKQIKDFMSDSYGVTIESLNKKEMPNLLKAAKGTGALEVLEMRNQLSKSSIKKYDAMINYANSDHRTRGLFQFYGASRTGRWAGRGIQLQNLPQNHLNDLELARQLVCDNDLDTAEMCFGNVSDMLSQLIRTAFIAPPNMTFAVADFSAIEARVIAWLAEEQWRLDVFAGDGKIYEASAAMMFHIPIESIKKGSDLRQKGKIAELALGFGGSLEALRRMGGEGMGLTDPEMCAIVKAWRIASPAIADFWDDVNECALRTVKYGTESKTRIRDIYFRIESDNLTIELLSGRKLFYMRPRLGVNRFGGVSIEYLNTDQKSKEYGVAETYGGKLVENIVQATARDLLAHSMLKVRAIGLPIVMHVHDELIAEVYKTTAATDFKAIIDIMAEPVPWAPGLILKGDGYMTDFYKKD